MTQNTREPADSVLQWVASSGPDDPHRPPLSVIVTIVGGSCALQRCLTALESQCRALSADVLVPFDPWCVGVEALQDRFGDVRFIPIPQEDLERTYLTETRTHGWYDLRRAVGLRHARGDIVAMTEDHAVPAGDWCERILEAHAESCAVIGGPIDNGIDRPLNWALYYCDFGRYGRPLIARDTAYVSDVNISYKRSALEATRDIWHDRYQETTLHWALAARGETMRLDPRPVVFQHRPPIGIGAALAERIEWGRVFAETRAARLSFVKRLLYALGAPLLPGLLAVRALRHMLRQKRALPVIIRILPLVLLLLNCWSIGEMIGYLVGPPAKGRSSSGALAGAG